ncbi:PilZ domain-containing protein [Simiduia aestuariiviva]|uniref:PilZ domain-containing protein n=1 Tax=Simiduia aestuariiviva TaxID=1510459 RepID=A0A839USL1_9GAMM|nr:PilZ domain-containing protein [Simiduia aestuariiviva]MBB3168498.1 hypothetical protein [Simiduia aestuariiviva]
MTTGRDPLQQDQRDAFRISDTLALHFRAVNNTDTPAEQHFPDQAPLQLFSEYKKLGHELNGLLANLDPSIHQALKLQEKRLDLLANLLFSDHCQTSQQSVNLSEGGLAFISTSQHNVSDTLAMSLTFLASGFSLFCYAQVIRCEKLSDGWRLACKFISLPEADQQLIARHILAAQRKPAFRQASTSQREPRS